MTGTQVLANQGGCTVWCEDCHESHNCETWTADKIRDWMASHGKSCPVAQHRVISESLTLLRQYDIPDGALAPLAEYADSLEAK